MKLLPLVAVLAAFLSSHASADWQSSYRAYQEAMAAGDGQTAKRHAREAWELTREALPPSENRAALAQNYATLAMFSDQPEDAVAPLEDAIALAAEGFGVANYDLPTLQFFLAYTESSIAKGNRQVANNAFFAAANVPDRLVAAPHPALAFRLLALRLLELEVYDRSFELMTRLVNQEFGMQPVNRKALQEDLSLRMFAAISDLPTEDELGSYRRSTTSRGEAIDRLELTIFDWRRHARLYPWQRSVEEFDPELAATLTSERLVTAFYRTIASNTRVDPFIAGLPEGRFGIVRQERCPAINWTRQALRFPTTSQGYNGAVMIGFHLNAQGRVEGARLLSEIPGERFGKDAVRQVNKWRADVEGVNPGCLRDQFTTIEFYNNR